MSDTSQNDMPRGSFRALMPLAVFLALYLVSSAVAGDFYCMPVVTAFLAAAVAAVAAARGVPLNERIERFSAGAANRNVMMMIWIFVLAGAFARSAEATGAVDATVALTLRLLPAEFVSAGFFLAACFVSISVGTSVGTIVALVPVASALAARTGADPAAITAVVVGGAFFGDNLSFISDTTIAATRTQGCELRDKFRVNIRIVLPAALITLLIYIFCGDSAPVDEVQSVDWFKVLPYMAVLGTALAGVNVAVVLVTGIVATGITGIASGSFGFFGWCGEIGRGISGMGELIIVTMLAGGVLEMIRRDGGIDWVIRVLTRRIDGRRGAEFGIAALVCMANVCTANNTIAIITVGEIARSVSRRFGVDPRRAASLLDTFSCFTQSLLPYGAQILMASGLAVVSPGAIIGHLYYPMLTGLCALAAIAFNYPRLKSKKS